MAFKVVFRVFIDNEIIVILLLLINVVFFTNHIAPMKSVDNIDLLTLSFSLIPLSLPWPN